MYRPKAFVVDDAQRLHAFIRAYPFALIAARDGEGIQFAYAPVVLDADNGPLGGMRFHLARANPLAQLDGARLRFAFRGPDAYVSPDWYATEGRVPTWNYVAVEAEGLASPLDDAALRVLVEDLSAAEEEKLRPKPPWTPDKVPAAKMEALLNAIRGFAVRFDTLEGKFKLSQNLPEPDRAATIAGLTARGDAASAAMASAMQEEGC